MLQHHNPFPGMNPFLELTWNDIHTRLIGYICDDLAQRGLPPGLRVRSDVTVVESWKSGQAPTWSADNDDTRPVALASPRLVTREHETERWVEITTDAGTLVTVIELLSHTNKQSEGRDQYLRKRRGYEGSGVNMVEIDLLRSGTGTVAAVAEPPSPPAEFTRYTICFFRAAQPERYEVYHWGLQDRIPAFAIPLRSHDSDTMLDLQPLVDRAYELGYYWQDNPATLRLDPPLSDTEHRFSLDRLAAAGFAARSSADPA